MCVLILKWPRAHGQMSKEVGFFFILVWRTLSGSSSPLLSGVMFGCPRSVDMWVILSEGNKSSERKDRYLERDISS